MAATLKQINSAQNFTDAGSMLASFMSNPNSKGRVSIGGQMASKAAAGAQMGMAAGPWGAAAGAVIGGALGLITGSADKRKEETMAAQSAQMQLQQQQAQGAAFASQNPEEIYGRKYGSYFKMGGKLRMYAEGGKLSSSRQLNSTTTELVGPSHEEGGIYLGNGNIAEGKETVTNQRDGTYVMTNLLGIADAHKKISKQIGKMENKAMTPERINSLKFLRNREQKLINLQQTLNGNR